MFIFQIVIGLINGLLVKLFPFLSHKGVINTQISIYNKLRRYAPEAPENDILNKIILSRIKSMPRVASKEEEYKHYELLLGDCNKTLHQVIYAIVEYEYILSRPEDISKQFDKMGVSESYALTALADFENTINQDIAESINKRTVKRA